MGTLTFYVSWFSSVYVQFTQILSTHSLIFFHIWHYRLSRYIKTFIRFCHLEKSAFIFAGKIGIIFIAVKSGRHLVLLFATLCACSFHLPAFGGNLNEKLYFNQNLCKFTGKKHKIKSKLIKWIPKRLER